MARIRTIKPEFWRSPDIMQLDHFQRLLYIGLWNLADDEGRGEYNAAAIAADLFLSEYSLNPHGVLTQVETAFTEYSNSGMVRLYRVKNRQYFEIINWLDHQRINRPSASKFPAYDQREQEIHAPLTEDSLNTHGALTVGKEQGTGNREQGVKDLSDSDESNDTPKPKRIQYTPEFEDWWRRFPKRTGSKKNAFTQFKSALNRIPLEELNAATDRLAAFVRAGHKEVQFVKDGERWLKEDRWEEELIVPQAPQPQSKNTLAGWGAPSARAQLANDQAVFDSPRELTWPN